MRIIKAYPPNFADLNRHFHLRGRAGVVFAYGDTIYVPSGHKLPSWLIAHEEAHGARQRALGVQTWWDTYLTSIPFRLEEELIGHRAEWKAFNNSVPMPSRTGTARWLDFMAKRLSGSLYGHMIGYEQAMREITG